MITCRVKIIYLGEGEDKSRRLTTPPPPRSINYVFHDVGGGGGRGEFPPMGVTAKVVLGQFGSYSGSQQKADVVKTDYSDSLLMITS